MKSEMLSTRIDHDTKVAFTNICDDVGLSPSQAIKLFARAVINHGGIPFAIKARQPNETTVAAMQELAAGKGQQSKSVDAMLDELTEGKVQSAHP
ncbi:damage-inducible protein J [Rheinheimera sp. EpRS3]|nr:damage-inducible protein J [Rheinheimera sp. EpRS3]